MYRLSSKVITTVILFVTLIVAATDIVISADARDDKDPVRHPEFVSGSQMMQGQEIPKTMLKQVQHMVRDDGMGDWKNDGKNDGDAVFSGVKKIYAKKGIVAFIELSSHVPADVYLMYPTQYKKYKTSGLLDGVIEFKEISWLFYPVPALLEDQTVYVVSKENITFNITYENIKERIDRLFAGEEQLRAGTEMSINNGNTVVRLTQLIPGLKVRLDLTENAQFVITRTIDLARYNKGLKDFDQLYKENVLKGSSDHFNFITSDFEDLYLLVRTDNQIRLKYMIWATKESAESGC